MAIPVQDKKEIIERLQAAKTQLVDLGVISIGIFGSFVSGNQTKTSDVDVLVEFSPDKHSFDNFMELSFLLEDILGRKVEVLTPEALSPYIGPHIVEEVENVPLVA